MEQRDNSGALFRNKDKAPDNNFPDYRGPCVVNGVELEVSAWLKTSKDGKTKFMSLAFKPPFKKGAPTQKGAKPDHFDDLDSDAPF